MMATGIKQSGKQNRKKRALVILGIIVAAMLLVVIVLGPIRSAYLDSHYAKFRQDHQAEHDAADAKLNQHDVIINGMQWHYVEQGPQDGPVILLLHGLPEGWYSWKDVIPLLDSKYRLIVPDMKGYGRSDKSDNNYNWHTVASQTLALMDYLKVDRFYVVGHDWGALIGTILVNDHPDRILGFVRMEADFVPSGSKGEAQTYLQKPQWLIFQNGEIGTWFMKDPGFFIDMVYKGRMTTPFKAEDRDYFVYEFSRPGVAERVPRYFEKQNWDTQTALTGFCKNKYPFPVLALQAESDPAQPKSSFTDASAECPNVELKWITNASHFDNLDQPGQVADAINSFVNGTNGK